MQHLMGPLRGVKISAVRSNVAILLARHHFHGLVRRGVEPYMNHNIRMAVMALELGFDHEVVMTAVLHDILEKTTCTPQEMRDAGVPDRVIRAVHYLTVPDHLPPSAKIERAEEGGMLSMVVAFLDQLDNLLVLEGEHWPHRKAAYIRYNNRIQEMQERWADDFKVLFEEMNQSWQ